MLENGDYVGRPEAHRDLQGQVLTSEVIDYRQEPDLLTVGQGIGEEVHRPACIRSGRDRPLPADHRRAAALGWPQPHRKSLFAVDSVHAFDVDLPTVTSKQHMDASIAIANAQRRDLFDARS